MVVRWRAAQLSEHLKSVEFDTLLIDVFDTILLRCVYPEYTKLLFSKSIKRLYNININVEILYLYRSEIEARLCEDNNAQGYDLEFRFEDMCQHLYDRLMRDKLLRDSVPVGHFCTSCRGAELEVERMVQHVDKEIIALLHSARDAGKKIVCVSDTYLSVDMIECLFEYHEITNLFDELIVSSDSLVTKRTGRLYEYLCTGENANHKLVMIGDNELSDYEMPRRVGIEAYAIDRRSQMKYYAEHEQKVASRSAFLSAITSELSGVDAPTGDNFIEIAYTLYYFIATLYRELYEQEIRAVFFLSREGEFIKKLFDEYIRLNQLEEITSNYLIVSRKSTFIASLESLDIETFDTLFRQYRELSAVSFLKSLGFDDNEISRVCKSKEKLLTDLPEDNFPESETFRYIMNNEEFGCIYELKRTTQKSLIKRYISEFDGDILKEGISLIDVGWKGTIQDHIYKIFDKQVVVQGFYLGLVADLMSEPLNMKKGMVFDYKNNDVFSKVFKENTAIFEVMLGASHGSADRYTLGRDGGVVPVMCTEEREMDIYNKIVRPLQNHLFDVFVRISKAYGLYHLDVQDMRREVALVHARIIYSPRKSEIEFFKKLYHFENFGIFKYSNFDTYKTSTLLKRLSNIKQFICDPREFFSRSFWKAAALDDIGLLILYRLYGVYQKYKMLYLGR